ncbi:hypothetical protein FACS1894191_2250 [Clostridia bacterium]|nr:hypothetical protein FACS1894191_2250 [Clostridia bacterium]
MAKAERREEIRQIALSAVSAESIAGKLLDSAKHIALYGAGNYGRQVSASLKELGFSPEMFIDRRADEIKEYCGLPVYKTEGIEPDARENLIVIVSFQTTINEFESLRSWLHSLGYINVINAARIDLLSEFSSAKHESISNNADAILAAIDLLCDETSETVFARVLRAHAEGTWSELPILNPEMTQYVDVNVPFRHKYRSFADCGAFTGDTLEALAARYRVERYFGFEPDTVSYAKLSETADALKDKIGSAVCFPIGVSDKNEFLKFSSAGGGGSKISDEGDEIIQVVRLDDVLKGYDDLMIKMDIEGAEIAALNGAKGIITSTAPDLAICVYHKISDLWKIPLLLKEWAPQYGFI